MGISFTRCLDLFGRIDMAWKTPRIVEICVGLEINSYACAEIA
jgi:coenzyme PQQ precursor peptide PqqA